MKNIKFAVLACGVLGLIGCFIPDHGMSFWDIHKAPTEVGGGAHIYMVILGYVVGAVMGAVGVAKGLKKPQAIIALVGFGFVLFKLRGLITEMLKHGGINGRLMMIAAIAGVVVSVIGIAKPEDAQ